MSLSYGGKATLSRAIHLGPQNIIKPQPNAYTSYQANVIHQIKYLAEKFPKKGIKQLQQLIEEFDCIDQTIRQLEKEAEEGQNQIPAEEEEVPLELFQISNIPAQEENKYLKEALVMLYKDYLGKIKQNADLKLRLNHSEQKIKRMECLHQSIKEIKASKEEKNEPEKLIETPGKEPQHEVQGEQPIRQVMSSSSAINFSVMQAEDMRQDLPELVENSQNACMQ